MEGGGEGGTSSPQVKPFKFSVYQNPNLSAALTATSIRPSKSTLLSIFSVSAISAVALISIVFREEGIIIIGSQNMFPLPQLMCLQR